MSWLNKYKLPKYQMMGTVPFASSAAPTPQLFPNALTKKSQAFAQQNINNNQSPLAEFNIAYNKKRDEIEKSYGTVNNSSYAIYADYPKQFSEDDFLNLTQGRYKGAKVPKKIIQDIIDSGKKNNYPIGKLLALVGRESTFGSGSNKNSRERLYGGPKSLLSGWDLTENYDPYEYSRFLADNKVPGIKTVKDKLGYRYIWTNNKEAEDYVQKHPQLLKKYQEKLAATKPLNGRNYYDLAIEFLKNKGVKGYNPGDPDYENKINQEYQLLSQDPALQAYLKQQGVTFENGGLHKYQQDGLVIPGVTDFVMPRAVSASTSAGVPKRNAQIDDQLIARKQNETYRQLISAGMDEKSAKAQSRSGVKMLPSTQKMLDAQKLKEYRTQMSQGYNPNIPTESQTYLADDNNLWSNLYRGKNMVMEQDMGTLGNIAKPFTFGIGANFVNTAEHIGSPYESYVQPGFMGALNNLAGDVMAVYPNLPIKGAQALNYGVQGIRGIPASLRGMNNMFNSTGELAESSFTTSPAQKAPPIDFNARNARVKQFWAEKQANKAGVPKPPTTAEEYQALLEQQRLEREAGDIIRNEGLMQPDPTKNINISEIANKQGRVSPGYQSSIEDVDAYAQLFGRRAADKFWAESKNDVLNDLSNEATNAANKARDRFIRDAKSFKKNVVDVDDLSQSPSSLYKNAEQLIKERNIRESLFPEGIKSDNPITNSIMNFFNQNMGLTDNEVAELLHGYNPSNPFTNWSNARINKSINLLQRQRLASGYMNPENAAQSVGVGKLPALKRFTRGEMNPLKSLSEDVQTNLKYYTDKQLIENGPDWIEETIARGKWKDVGMEMRGSMTQMGFDPTNEQDVLRFAQRFKAQQLGQKLNQYSGKPDIEQLFGRINKNKNGGLIKFTNGGKGNTWYEFDIPESFKGGLGDIKAFKEGGAIVSTEGYKQGPPPPGSHYRIPSNTLYNPTPYRIKATPNVGPSQWLEPYDTSTTQFPGASYVDEYPMMQEGGWLEQYQTKGQVTLPPIFTDNPNDPRLRAFNDSSYMNKYGETEKAYLQNPKTTVESWNNWHKKASNYRAYKDENNETIYGVLDGAEQAKRRLALYNYNTKWAKDKSKINYPEGFINEKDYDKAYFDYLDKGPISRDFSEGTILGALGFGKSGNSYQYSKPVQPVIYKRKQQSKPKPGGWKPLTPEVAKGRYSGDISNMVYRETGDPDNPYNITGIPPKPEPTLNRKPVAVQPITANTQKFTPQLRTIEQSNIELPAVQRGKYRTSYYDPQMKDWNERAFMSQQESDQFANEMSQRGYPGSYGNVTQRVQYKFGGSELKDGGLYKYQIAGSVCPPGFTKNAFGQCVNASGQNPNQASASKNIISQAAQPAVVNTKPLATPFKNRSQVVQENIDRANRENYRLGEYSNQAVVGQARASTLDEERERIRKNNLYASQNSNATMDAQGNLSTVNPNRTMEGKALPYTRAAGLDKGMTHFLGALDAASMVTGVGELANIGWNGLKSMRRPIMSNAAVETLPAIQQSGVGNLKEMFTNPKQYFTKPIGKPYIAEGASKFRFEPTAPQNFTLPEFREAESIADLGGREGYNKFNSHFNQRIGNLKRRGSTYDQAGLADSDWLSPDTVHYHGTFDGRPIVETKMPNGNSEYFYKSSGWAGKQGAGANGTTEGMWQVYDQHGTALGKDARMTKNWFAKGNEYDNWYGSNTFRNFAGNMDKTLTEKYGLHPDELDQFLNFQNRSHKTDTFVPGYSNDASLEAITPTSKGDWYREKIEIPAPRTLDWNKVGTTAAGVGLGSGLLSAAGKNWLRETKKKEGGWLEDYDFLRKIRKPINTASSPKKLYKKYENAATKGWLNKYK
jgi:hypothetical protein